MGAAWAYVPSAPSLPPPLSLPSQPGRSHICRHLPLFKFPLLFLPSYLFLVRGVLVVLTCSVLFCVLSFALVSLTILHRSLSVLFMHSPFRVLLFLDLLLQWYHIYPVFTLFYKHTFYLAQALFSAETSSHVAKPLLSSSRGCVFLLICSAQSSLFCCVRR